MADAGVLGVIGAAATFLAAAGWACSAGATTIDDTGSYISLQNAFGPSGHSATFGQTFTAAAGDTFLDSFSLFLTPLGGSGQFDLRGYVAGWDGTRATSILYASDTRTMVDDGGATREFAFTPDVTLVPGQQYVAFLSVSDLGTQSSFAAAAMPVVLDTAIPGGNFVFLNNGLDFSALTTQTWGSRPEDVWFRGTASTGPLAVPEPGTLALLGTGLLGLGLALRRRPVRLPTALPVTA